MTTTGMYESRETNIYHRFDDDADYIERKLVTRYPSIAQKVTDELTVEGVGGRYVVTAFEWTEGSPRIMVKGRKLTKAGAVKENYSDVVGSWQFDLSIATVVR